MIDVVMPVDSTRLGLRAMTQATINSLITSEPGMEFNIVVVDGNKQTLGFENAKTVTYDFPFNYHKCVNLGLTYGDSDTVAICNNDLLFDPLWLTKTLAAMGDKYLSASPNNKTSTVEGIIEGYKVASVLLGWCIVLKRRIFEMIGKLDEVVNFWYSDNVYGEQLRRAGIKHILVLHARVLHLGSRTLRAVKNKPYITLMQKKVFNDWRTKT
jgi:hypothetical protein